MSLLIISHDLILQNNKELNSWYYGHKLGAKRLLRRLDINLFY